MPSELLTDDLRAADGDAMAQRLLGETTLATPAPVASDGKPELTPAQQWQVLLDAAGIDVDQAREIQRAMLRKGHWEKTYALWDGLLKVTLRTAWGDVRMRVTRALDMLTYRTGDAVRETTSRVQLAACLLRYDDGERNVAFEFPARSERSLEKTDALHAARDVFIDTIPGDIQPHVFRVLAHFDGCVRAALAAGSVGSF